MRAKRARDAPALVSACMPLHAVQSVAWLRYGASPARNAYLPAAFTAFTGGTMRGGGMYAVMRLRCPPANVLRSAKRYEVCSIAFEKKVFSVARRRKGSGGEEAGGRVLQVQHSPRWSWARRICE